MKCTLVKVTDGTPFVAEAEVLNNGDGSVSFKLPTGGYAGQEPNQYGVRHDQNDGALPKAYQRATLLGSTVTFLTRPQDVPFVYLFAQGRTY